MSTQNPQSLRIFTIISQLEQLLESAPKPKLGSGGRSLIDIDELFDLLGDMKVTIPEDIRRANSVLLETETLLYNSKQEAADILEAANNEAEALREQARSELALSRQAAEREYAERVSEDAVHLEVQRRCEILQQHAEYNANLVFNNAKEYADAILQDLQRYLMEYHQLVGKNRLELDVSTSANRGEPMPQAVRPPEPVRPVQPPVQPPQPDYTQQEQPPSPAEEPVFQANTLPDEDEMPAKRRRGGLFRKSEASFLSEEEADAAQEVMPPRRARKKSRKKELDLDLDE